jgi:hypothetical protein
MSSSSVHAWGASAQNFCPSSGMSAAWNALTMASSRLLSKIAVPTPMLAPAIVSIAAMMRSSTLRPAAIASAAAAWPRSSMLVLSSSRSSMYSPP